MVNMLGKIYECLKIRQNPLCQSLMSIKQRHSMKLGNSQQVKVLYVSRVWLCKTYQYDCLNTQHSRIPQYTKTPTLHLFILLSSTWSSELPSSSCGLPSSEQESFSAQVRGGSKILLITCCSKPSLKYKSISILKLTLKS